VTPLTSLNDKDSTAEAYWRAEAAEANSVDGLQIGEEGAVFAVTPAGCALACRLGQLNVCREAIAIASAMAKRAATAALGQ
jgi:hypothetical protein